ncbi:MAG: lamin tail domain-containing protein [Verrucomicrobiota bacterium]
MNLPSRFFHLSLLLALPLTALPLPAEPLVLRHRWQLNEPAGSTSFDDSLAPGDSARAIQLRGSGATVAGNGRVELPGGSPATAPWLDLPNGMASARPGDTTYEGWASIGGSQTSARLLDFGSSTMGEVSAPGGTGTASEYLGLLSQVAASQTNQRLTLLENGTIAQGDATVPYTAGQTFHFAVVYDADGNNGQPQLRYYRNGTLGATVNSTRLLKNILDNNCWLGRSNSSTDNNFQGAYEEFRVWDGAMFPDEITDSIAAWPSGQLANALHIDTFSTAAVSIYSGQSTTLTWAIANPGGPLTASISGGIGTLPTASGSTSITPLTTTSYTLTCGNGTATRTATVNVTVLNPVITANHAALKAVYQTDLPITLPAVSVPVVPMSYTITRLPAHGQLTGTAPNLTYRPDPGYLGRDNFAYTATGGVITSKVGGISIEVTPDIPVASNLAVTTGYNTAATFNLPGTDPDNDPLTWTILTSPVQGSLTGTGISRTYTPALNFSGTDSFTCRANDGTYDSGIATVTITVLPPPSDPAGVVLSDNKILTTDTTGSFLARLQASDPNSTDTHTFQLVAGAGDAGNSLVQIIGNQLLATSSFTGSLGQNIQLRIQVTDSTGRSSIQQIVLPVQAPVKNILINEIHYNPARNEIPAEFIELHNPLATAVDLSGWQFSSGVSYSFPVGTVMAPGSYLVIAENPATILGMYGVTALGPWTGNLNSDGEDVELRDNTSAVVDLVDYGVVSPWPAGSNGNGPSMELIHPTLKNDLGSNWRASTTTASSFNWLPATSTGWRYRKGTTALGEPSSPVTAWRSPGFTEDATWLTGRTPLGTSMSTNVQQETGIAAIYTILSDMNASSYRSVALRKTFEVTAPLPKSVLLRVLHNDAAIVWINGLEAVRLSMRPGDKTYNTSDYYEQGNTPWSEIVLANADQLFVSGTNVIAIQAFAKPPQVRTAQDDSAFYGSYDFAVDAEIRNVPDGLPTPGAVNSNLSTTAAPAVREITHTPTAPVSTDPLVVTARVTDPQGVQSVQLLYQIVAPGNFIPARLPLTATQLVANPDTPRPLNSAFENAANWITVAMSDQGGASDGIAGDAVYQGVIPAQPHRTLIRYRIRVTDFSGQTALLPYADDPALNWAAFSYNGVPNYVSGANTFTTAQLTSVPVYHFLMRETDRSTLMAYNGSEQMANSIALNALRARRTENWECAMVSDGIVYDHINTRLRGGNSRYQGSGKRHLRLNFNKGYSFAAKDEKGRPYPVPWDAMLVNKLFGNKGYMNWGLDFEVGAQLWKLNNIPVPESHWFHMRMIRSAAEAPAATTGDFYGLFQADEFADRRFLEARGMEKGNLYKLSDWTQNGEMLDRFGAPGAPQFSEDYDNYRYNIHGAATEAFMKTYVDMPAWYRYSAVQEAIRHYDIFTEPTGRHRMKNLILYFQPMAGTNGLGRALTMPYDWDASFGPNWNSGQDTVRNGIYNHNTFTDSPTWGTIQPRPTLPIEHRNAIREFRDLVWQEDQVNPMIDTALATISQIWTAERARWPVSGAVGDHVQGPVFKAQDMKNFAFTGWTDPFGADPAVTGGRDNYLDTLADSSDTAFLPARPVISYTGTTDYALDGLSFATTAFTDPQGAANFSGMQWRIGEITDPISPAYVPGSDPVYEATPVWESGTLTTFNASVNIPAGALRTGRTYRARVRYLDITGRFSHWSLPHQFTASGPDILGVLRRNLIISEFMYKPLGPDAAQAALGYVEADFEFIEVRNLSPTATIALTDVRFTKGVDFDFPPGTELLPGAHVLVVRNAAAFASRYGAGQPVAGTWRAGQNLSNSTEEIKLSFGAGAAIREFTYFDDVPWPAEADNGGISLVYAGPQPLGDATEPQATGSYWRASYTSGGTPGGEEFTSLASWMTSQGYTDPLADPDHDGWSHLATFALGLDLGAAPPAASNLAAPGGPWLVLTYTRRRGLTDVSFIHQQSTLLNSWLDTGTTITGQTILPDGTEQITVRLNQAIPSQARAFLRVKLTSP